MGKPPTGLGRDEERLGGIAAFVELHIEQGRRLVDEDVLDALLSSRDAVDGRTANAQLVLFARRGFTRALQRRAAREHVLLVTAAQLFE